MVQSKVEILQEVNKMKFLEFGNSENKKIMLIHGIQTPWQVWRPQIEYFSKRYHIIVPILDGHNPEEKSTFSSVHKEAENIENYYIEHYGDKIFGICGMSMGGTIASILWVNDRLHIEKLFLEGAPLVQQNKMITSIIINQYLNLTHKTQQRDLKTLNTCEKTFIPKKYMRYFLEMIDAISDDTIKNCAISVGQFQLPKNLKMDNVDILYYHGTTLNEMVSKKSAKYLKRHYPQAIVICQSGYSHCELSLHHPEQHIEIVEKFLAEC